LARVYVDTSVVVALSDPADEFHGGSVSFVSGLQDRAIPSSIGPPFMLEMAKAAKQRGTQAALRLIAAIEEYKVEFTKVLGDPLWTLSSEYASLRVLRGNRTLDLLHYASATQLGCSHLASWDKKHFNEKVEKLVNSVNASRGLTTLKVGDPATIARYLGIA